MLTQARLKDLLSYDPASGVWTWRPRKGRGNKAGKIAGCIGHWGYRVIGIDDKLYRSSRLAFLYMLGHWPPVKVDHRNGQRADDRWDNLRLATDYQNAWNTCLSPRNTSGFKSVYFNKQRGYWYAGIWIRGQYLWLGRHSTAEIAHEAVRVARLQHFGEFARDK
jgi:hypothetical protein